MIKTSTNFLNRDSRGIMISQRPAEVKAVRSSRINPFISTISYKLPLGLPSIKNTVIHRKINKGEQHVSHPVKKHIRICNETKIKINDNITQSIQTPDDQTNHNCKLSREEIINLELPHQEVMKNNSVIKEIEPQPKNFCEDIDIDTQNLLNFMNNLDYEKYLKNLEIREALLLIKNKVEREAKEIQREEEVKIESKQGTEPEISFEKLVLPNISVPEIKKAEHDKEWYHSTKISEIISAVDEKSKLELADNLLKTNKLFRQVHSVQSIKKLLDREGITQKIKQNPLKISIIKDKESIYKFEHKPTLLPNLRELPFI